MTSSKNKNYKSIALISLATLCLLCFLVFAILVMCGKKFGIDQWSINFFSKHRSIGLTNFVKIYTYLGSFYCLGIFVALFCFFSKNKRMAYVMLANFALICIMCFVLKHIVCRVRPLDTAVISVIGYSFPSGHSSMTMSVCALIVFYICKYSNKTWLKILSSVLLFAFILSMGLTRIYLGVHYFTDVVAGYLLGFVCALVSILFFNLIDFERREKLEKK